MAADVALPAEPYLSFFAGVGGLDLALRIARPQARCIGAVEIDVEAACVLASRMDEGSLDAAPIWSDVRSFPCRNYRGRVAGIVAGFPCPDYSVAGKRAGIIGKHGQLWDHLALTIGDLGPDWLLLENVSGIYVPHGGDAGAVLPAGLWFVLGDLATLGFDAEWICIRASDVGASHGRARWFCLAYKPGGRLGILREPSRRYGFTDGRRSNMADTEDDNWRGRVNGTEAGTGPRGIWRWRHAGERAELGNAIESGLEFGIGPRWTSEREQSHIAAGTNVADARLQSIISQQRCDGTEYQGSGRFMADAEREPDRAEQRPDAGERADSSAAHGPMPRDARRVPLFAPGPADSRWTAILAEFPELAPAISEEAAEQFVHGLDDGLAATLAGSRTDQLRACGNGVVALQAAAAFTILARRISAGLAGDGPRRDRSQSREENECLTT